VIVICSTTVNAVTLKCDFDYSYWNYVGIYTCYVEDNGIFDGSRITIDKIEGEHKDGKTNADVQGIFINNKIQNLNYFPQDLDKSFPNLIAIIIKNAQLKEIKQADIMNFPSLIRLILSFNDIKTIEKDLFKYNPQLQYIDLENNEISHIDYEVFNNLTQLETLWLHGNKCKNYLNSADTRSNLLKLFKQYQDGDCIDSNYVDNTTSEPIESTTEEESPNNAKKIVFNLILCSITCLTIFIL
jgi:hypothetical protein